MDEDTAIINRNTRNQKIKNFFIDNKKILIILISVAVLILIGYFVNEEIKKRNKVKLANKFNTITINFLSGNMNDIEIEMTKIILSEDKTYSPLALYFLLDNNILKDKKKVNNLFDILINKTKLEKEIKYLVIYKKALYNSNFETENNMLKILNPLLNSDSIWKSHALQIMAEYFFEKNQKNKSKEFFQQILDLKNANINIKSEARKRIQSDFTK